MTYVNRDLPMCTAQKRSGSFCNGKPLPDAPFPICVTHAAEVMRYLNSYLPKDSLSRLLVGERISVVYYLRLGDIIKIGTTSDLQTRMRGYPPHRELLVTEHGGPRLERQRHIQFSGSLRHGNEWFEPTPDLMAHIAGLQAAKAA